MWSVMQKVFIAAVVAGVLALAVSFSPAEARISTADAAARAQERFDGQVVDVDLDDDDDDGPKIWVYEIKLLTRDNVIIKVKINADTGAFIEAKGDNLIPYIRRPKS